MTIELLREKLWQSYFAADVNVRYWKMYGDRAQLVERSIKSILALASVMSAAAFCIADKWHGFATLMAVVSGVIATVFVPVFGLDGVAQKIIRIRNRWIDVRLAYESLREEAWESPDAADKIGKKFARWQEADKELEQEHEWLPVSEKFRTKATVESETILTNV